MSANDFQILSRLGEGSYSSVWKVIRLSDGKEYAMKKVKINALKEKEKENALNEVRILASIQSPFIIGYKEAFFDDDSMTLCIVMEFAANGDIYHRIQQHLKKGTYFSEREIWQVFIQILKALKTLHSKKILHRDLKCANIFLTADGTAKLGDLNVSKVAKNNLVYTQTGTPYYAAPEVWRDQPYDAKSDIWSLGCVIYEMAALKPPFRANDMQGLYKKVQIGAFDKIPSHYSSDLFKAISLCLQTSPTQRPSCDQLLGNPLIAKYAKEINTVVDPEPANSELLRTIKIPKNIRALGQQLPKSNYNAERHESPKKVRPYTTIEKQRPIVSSSAPIQKKIERVVSADIKRRPPLVVSNNNRMKSPEPERKKPVLANVIESEEEFLARMKREYLDRAKGYHPTTAPSKNLQSPTHVVNLPNRVLNSGSKPLNLKPLASSPKYALNELPRHENLQSPQSLQLKERALLQKYQVPDLRSNQLTPSNRPISEYQYNRPKYGAEIKYDHRAAYENLLKERKMDYLSNVPSANNYSKALNLPTRNDGSDVLQKYQNIYKSPSSNIYGIKKENPSMLAGIGASNLYGYDRKELYYASPSSGIKSPVYSNSPSQLKSPHLPSYKPGIGRPPW